MNPIQNSVQNYYGKQLKTSADLKTSACCTFTDYPQKIKTILSEIHEEVLIKYYGCGLTIPQELEGLKILDLGSGSGRDCFLASKLVGPKGQVLGVDMTDEQLAIANQHIDYHTKKFGYPFPNVKFQKGHLEELDLLVPEHNSLDLIISNCVINLSTDKQKVLRDCFQLLKMGGEMYFSDIYVNKRIPSELANDSVLYGECLSGSLYWNDFLTFAKNAGFSDPRVVEATPVTLTNPEIEEKLKGFQFYSVTYRLFKIDGLEGDCEDYGQAVMYKGTIDDSPIQMKLDQGHLFTKGKVQNVCGNTYLMLAQTRFQKHFDFIGNFENHLGIFPNCGTANPFAHLHAKSNQTVTTGCC